MPTPKNIAVVYGTRPSVIKLAPVVRALRARGAETLVVSTNQQPDLLPAAERAMKLLPDVTLAPRAGGLGEATGALVAALAALFADAAPEAVVVVGDTATGLAGALAGFMAGARVAHVEAGLRTDDLRLPFPEEANRRVIDQLADWHFAPTPRAVRALDNEGKAGSTWLTGNTAVDALQWARAEYGMDGARDPAAPVLITLHRRENWPRLPAITGALADLAHNFPGRQFIWPAHPGPAVQAAARQLRAPNARVCAALPYDQFLPLLLAAPLVITDSGGVQEECACAGVPCLVVRPNTERPEAVDAGVSRLVEPGELCAVASELLKNPIALADMAHPCNAYGDGRAAERIAAILTDNEPGDSPRV